MKGESSAGRTRGRRWLYLIPVLVLVLLFTGNSWDWRAAESLGESLARSESRNTAEQIALRVEGMLHERENDLALLAELWHTYPEASRGERFEADASRLVQDEPSYYSINFVDADSIIRHSVSPTNRAELIGLDLKTRPGRKEMHEQVRQSMKPAISPPMELVSGRPGVVIWFPVRAGGLDTPAEGCIAGAFHIEEILRRAVADYSRKTFCIRVCLDGVEAWKAEWPSEGKGHPLESMGASGAVIFLGRTWSIDVHPRQDSVYAELPRGNLIRLGMNLLLSLVIAALLFIALYEVGRVRTSRAQLIEARRDRERLFNLSVDMFCVAGFDGFFKELNPAWTKRLGWSEEELRSTSALEFVHPDDRAATKEQIDRLRAGEAVQMFESRLRTASGGFCSTEWTAIPLIEEELIFGVVRDTTAQREIQAALRESEERFRATFEQAAVGIAHVSADGRFMRVNERFCQIVGYSRDEMLTRTFQTITHPDDLDSSLLFVRKLLSGGPASNAIEKRYVTKQGLTVWVNLTATLLRDSSDKPQYFIAVAQDITERKRAAEELRESEDRFRRLTENAKDLIYRMSLPDGRYEYVSPAAQNVLGYTSDELYANPQLLRRAIHPAWIGYYDAQWKEIIAGNVAPSYEFQIVDKVGRTRWLHQRNVLIRGEQGEPAALEGIVTDVTERKESEDALREREQLFDTVINAAQEAVLAIGEDGLITLFNPAAEVIFGRRRKEMIGQSLDCLMPEKYRADHAAQVCGYFTTGKPNAAIGKMIELPGLHSDGREFPMAISLSAARAGDQRLVIAVARDITAQKRASEEVQARLDRVQHQQTTVVELAKNEAVAAGQVKASAAVVTQAVADTLGIERAGVWLLSDDGEELRCMDQFQSGSNAHSEGPVLKTSEYPRYMKALEAERAIDAPAAQADSRTSEFRDGYLVPLGIASMLDAVVRVRGRVAGVVCCEHVGKLRVWQADEVTFAGEVADLFVQVLLAAERRRGEDERRKLESQVQQTQKLESLGVLAGGIAHDFNNVLAAVLGNAELALEDLSADSPVRVSIEEIQVAARHAADLCRQMLAYSGKGRFVVEPLNINDVVAGMAHLLDVAVSKKATLRRSLAPNLPSFEGDSVQVRQVVINLITNASESLGDQPGTISISTGAKFCEPESLRQPWLPEEQARGMYVYLDVTDTGCGMSRETVERVFDPFFTTKFTGRGLGLAAALGIMRGHRGLIKVYSEPGQGTTFRVFFPAIEDTVPATSGPHVNAAALHGSGNILVVDDDPLVRHMVTRVLERAGYTVTSATNGREAVDRFRQGGADVDCILMDLTMPEMDGAEAFRALRALQIDVPVLLSSGYSEQELSRRFAALGFAGFVQKPYERESLLSRLKEILGGLT